MGSREISVQAPMGKPICIGNEGDLVLISGPCAIESRDHSMKMAEAIGKVCKKLNVKWIFKACYDKDCR